LAQVDSGAKREKTPGLAGAKQGHPEAIVMPVISKLILPLYNVAIMVSSTAGETEIAAGEKACRHIEYGPERQSAWPNPARHRVQRIMTVLRITILFLSVALILSLSYSNGSETVIVTKDFDGREIKVRAGTTI
jgi:hypothetical protein